jgi:flagellin-like protein
MSIKKEIFVRKKALSPIITTILLILLAIVLAAIILLWALGFVKEHVSKFDSSTGQEKPIGDACSAVSLDITNEDNQIYILNTGNIPVNKVGIRISLDDGTSSIEEQTISLIPGAAKTITASNWQSGSGVEVIPILLGKTQKSEKYTDYTCEQKFVPSA